MQFNQEVVMMKQFIGPGVLFTLAMSITPAFAQAGHLDPSFGTGGVVTNNAPFTEFAGAALAANGDIIVAGSTSSIATILRFLPNGTPDPSFGTDGVVSLPAPSSFFLGESFPLALAVQSNGEILITYYAFNNTSTESESLLLRLTTSGQPDTTFGSAGQVPLSFPVPASWSASVTSILAQPDGKILLTGNITPPFRNHSAPLTLLARYLSNGALDTTYGTSGISEVVTPIDLPISIALLSGDGLLALGSESGVTVSQFTSTGALAGSVTGGAIIELGNIGDVAFQTNADILVGGAVAGTEGKTNTDGTVERFELNGSTDPTFEPPIIRFAPDAPETKTELVAVAEDSAGRIVATGELVSANSGSGVARLNANGTLDATFGSDGISTITPGFVVYSELVQTNNQIVMVSGNGSLARYLAQ
jgi:uncharacterized delta-60 repeat protein